MLEGHKMIDIDFIGLGMDLRVIEVAPFAANNDAATTIHFNRGEGARFENFRPCIKAVVVSVRPMVPIFAVILTDCDG